MDTETVSFDFEYVADRFADIEIMRYRFDGWDSLSLQQKELIYYLSKAALCGRDIFFDQNCGYNLDVKSFIDGICQTYSGNRKTEAWKQFETYAKKFWFANGIHHHYSNDKFYPEVEWAYLNDVLDLCDSSVFEMFENEDFNSYKERLRNIIYNPEIAPVRTAYVTSVNSDLVRASAVNFYENVTQEEVERFYRQLSKNADTIHPLSWGVNSRLLKTSAGKIKEEVYQLGACYSQAIEQILFWLKKAKLVSENDLQQKHIAKLIEYYQKGDLKIWDDYNILWVSDQRSAVDYVNGFIEVYTDPLSRKATWEALVNVKDEKNSQRTEMIAQNAPWFEENSPIDQEFKKKEVKGISAKVINVVQLGGDCYPSTPIGINLPNADWIRKEYGSKSVTLENIMYAYDQARLHSGFADEFYFSSSEIERQEKYGYQTEKLLVDLHECLGHGSGQNAAGVNDNALKNYQSVIEETRADLFALYFLADNYLVEMGLLPNEEAYKAGYYKYIMNGFMLQLNRVDLGNLITQSHMRNRSIIAQWCFQHGQNEKIIEKIVRDEKSYLKINDYNKLRSLIGQLLKEVQHIKSTGDFAAAKDLVETYGVHIEEGLHKEVKKRYALLDVASYGGFINPTFQVNTDKNDHIIDIQLDYTQTYIEQMLDYDQNYHYIKPNSFIKKH